MSRTDHDLETLFRESTADLAPDVTALVAGGLARGRSRHRRRGVGAALVAVAVVVAAVSSVPGLLEAPREPTATSPDWDASPVPPRPIDVLRVAGREVWLAHGQRPGEDVRVLSVDDEGSDPEWGGLPLARHGGEPVSDVDWGVMLLEVEEQVVFYTTADDEVDSLRVSVAGERRNVTSHRVGRGSYALFAVPFDVERVVLTPLRSGSAVAGGRQVIDVPRP